MSNISATLSQTDFFEQLKSSKSLTEKSMIWDYITNIVENCMVPELTKPYDEFESSWKNEYNKHFTKINANLNILSQIIDIIEPNFSETQMNKDFVATFLLLLEEMKENSALFDSSYSSHLSKASSWFQKTHDFHLLYNSYELNVNIYRDEIFYLCMQKIHIKLTRDRWKLYPLSLHCYRMAINQWLKIQKIRCPLPLIFPVTLMQIDDFNETNQKEGLTCCSSILKYLDNEYINTGYEVVVYETVLKYVSHRNLEILSEALMCITLLLPIFYTRTPRSTWTKSDDVFEIVLENLYTESCIKKESIYFQSLPRLIRSSGNSVIRWKNKIMLIIHENLELCMDDEGIQKVLLVDCLKTLKAWFKLSWPVWSQPTDCKTVSCLYKVIFAICQNPNENSEEYLEATEDCLITMLSCCTEKHRALLLDDEGLRVALLGDKFLKTWRKIKDALNEKSQQDCGGKYF